MPRPQIHLSTALVLMFVAAGLVWANVQTHWILAGPGSTAYGWPYFAYATERIHQDDLVGHFYFKSIVYNVGVAVAVLGAVAAICECWIRRRAARNAESAGEGGRKI